jgi:hypothetical protein
MAHVHTEHLPKVPISWYGFRGGQDGDLDRFLSSQQGRRKFELKSVSLFVHFCIFHEDKSLIKNRLEISALYFVLCAVLQHAMVP